MLLGTNDGFLIRADWGKLQPSDSLALSQVLSVEDFQRYVCCLAPSLLNSHGVTVDMPSAGQYRETTVVER